MSLRKIDLKRIDISKTAKPLKKLIRVNNYKIDKTK